MAIFYYPKILCLSTDTKPAAVDGMTLVESNTGAWFKRVAGAWVACANSDFAGVLPAASVAWGGVTGTLSNQSDLQTALDAKLAAASYTAADVLAKLLTVDGAGSGVDADLLDGQSAAAFAAASHSHVQADVTNLVSDLAAKQATLVSGTNIKTINGSTVLGSGDLTVSGADLAIAPASSQTINAGLSRYIPDEYEIVDTFETEIGDGAIMEIG